MKQQAGNIAGRKHFSAYSINIIFILLALVGIALLPRLTIKLNPGFVPNSLTVSYNWPDAMPAVIEHEVTARLEGAFSTLRNISQVISESSHGHGFITLEAKKGADLQTLRFEILSVIKDLWPHLPEGVSYPEISAGSAADKSKKLLSSYVLQGEAGTYELQLYAESVLFPQLAAIPGISQVAVYGSTPFEWQLHYNEEQLRVLGIQPHQLYRAIQSAGAMQGLGQVRVNNWQEALFIIPVSIKTPGLSETDNAWKNIPVVNTGGRIIQLGELVTLKIEQQQARSYFRINGLNTININLYSDEAANQIAVANEVEKTLASLSPEMPPGFFLEKMYDSTEFLRNELGKTAGRALLALLILLVFIFLVNRSPKYLLIITICLFVNLTSAIILYFLFRVEIHLVSIAGITVSLSIIIDNYIMMTNYLLQQRSLASYTAILGSTLTTLGALLVIFFLGDHERNTLIDFAMVVIINLAVSLAIALFFIPALVNRLQLRSRKSKYQIRRKRLISKLNVFYARYILFAKRWRWAMILIIVFSFGLPLFLMPDKLKSDTIPARIFNSTLGSDVYRRNIKPHVDKWAGGTLRLFVQNNLNKFRGFRVAQEPVLYIRASLPRGATIEQMNELCIRLEKYLAGFEGIRQFQTTIGGPQNATIIVYFDERIVQSPVPQRVKSFMVSKAIEFSGADFSIFMNNESFSNVLQESWRQWRIVLSGYNYRELLHLAQQTSDTLELNPRIRSVAIFSGDRGRMRMATEEHLFLETDKNALAFYELPYLQMVNELSMRSAIPRYVGSIQHSGVMFPLRMVSEQARTGDLWLFMNQPVFADSSMIRLSETSAITTARMDGSIFKRNQSYRVTVAYDFIGPEHLAKVILQRETERLNARLPIGYSAEIPVYDYSWLWGRQKVNYWLIGLVIIVIWAICAVIFESFIQPLAVICAIPISYIGVFLTFYLFNIAFDQGGFAAFILLSGIVVNMSIYIFNDINYLRRTSSRSGLDIYIKAFNIKIVPVLLSSMAAVLALLPFIIFDKDAVFWYALAVGTIGGIVFSIPVLVLYLPLLVKLKKRN